MPKKTEPKIAGLDIENTIKEIKAKFGDEAIMKLGDRPKVGIGAISIKFGVHTLDTT